MSLRTRLIVAVMTMSVVLLGGAFAIIYVAVHQSELRQLDVALLREAREEAAEAAEAGGSRLMISDRPGPLADDTGPLTKFAAIYDGAGRVVDLTETLEGRTPAFTALPQAMREPFDLWVGDERLRAVVVPVGQSGSILLLAAPRAYLDADEVFLARTMALVLLGALLSSLFIASWVMGRLTRDHAAIARAVRDVAGGDLSARADVPPGAGETVQLARDVNEMISRIEALLDAHSRFIAHASHELRSPLTLLYGELSLVLRRTREPAEYQEAIEEALESTRELMRLTEHLLALARLGGGGPEEREPFDLGAVVEEVADDARRAFGEGAPTIDLAVVRVDIVAQRTDLTRLVHNLIGNALRHATEGIEVELSSGDEWARLEVRDDGPGVPDEERERIFEPFYRLADDRARDQSGTGLGLALVRETVRAHGGHVWVEANSPRGARFIVELPLRVEAPA